MEQNKPKSNRGGARPGAGRKPGGTNNLTIETLLVAIQQKSGGLPYEALLAEDFVNARNSDSNLAQKYHNLILSKVAPTLAKIETVNENDEVSNKAEAFAEALLALTKVGKK